MKTLLLATTAIITATAIVITAATVVIAAATPQDNQQYNNPQAVITADSIVIVAHKPKPPLQNVGHSNDLIVILCTF